MEVHHRACVDMYPSAMLQSVGWGVHARRSMEVHHRACVGMQSSASYATVSWVGGACTSPDGLVRTRSRW